MTLVLIVLLLSGAALAEDGLVPVDPVDPTVTVEQPSGFGASPARGSGAEGSEKPPLSAVREGLDSDGDLVPELVDENEAGLYPKTDRPGAPGDLSEDRKGLAEMIEPPPEPTPGIDTVPGAWRDEGTPAPDTLPAPDENLRPGPGPDR